MLYSKAYAGDCHPAGKAHDNRFAAVFDEVDDVGVQPDCSHCHDDEKFTAEFHQGEKGKHHAGDFRRKNAVIHAVVADSRDYGSDDEIQNEHRESRFDAGFIRAGGFFRRIKSQNECNRNDGERAGQFDDGRAVQNHCTRIVHTVPGRSRCCNGRCVIDSRSGENGEAFVGKSEHIAECREYQCGDYIKQENNGNSLGDFFVIGINYGRRCRNRRAAADG